MDVSQFIALAGQYGPVGVLCVYLLLREEKRDKRENERELRLEKRDAEREARWEAVMRENATSNNNSASAMTLLAERLNRVRGL